MAEVSVPCAVTDPAVLSRQGVEKLLITSYMATPELVRTMPAVLPKLTERRPGPYTRPDTPVRLPEAGADVLPLFRTMTHLPGRPDSPWDASDNLPDPGYSWHPRHPRHQTYAAARAKLRNEPSFVALMEAVRQDPPTRVHVAQAQWLNAVQESVAAGECLNNIARRAATHGLALQAAWNAAVQRHVEYSLTRQTYTNAFLDLKNLVLRGCDLYDDQAAAVEREDQLRTEERRHHSAVDALDARLEAQIMTKYMMRPQGDSPSRPYGPQS